ncbi:hypothetical protein SporoP37_15925 [Sporosarcina sp. P37]|uniref:hypothetical protein n=1 Tax=unclassified Sporosarcina TaxID=2647733 RepID=UPI000A17FAE2|nr:MULTISPECIES: hypothetical protein [unclassified Sporosarcina]ARK26015.1 hypothetical protein SporoP37_15925 [Sporosarcina sp. P37]PID19383.1 hypothetical protein CSV62_02445 [Sporosarcina sp. P35]
MTWEVVKSKSYFLDGFTGHSFYYKRPTKSNYYYWTFETYPNTDLSTIDTDKYFYRARILSESGEELFSYEMKDEDHKSGFSVNTSTIGKSYRTFTFERKSKNTNPEINISTDNSITLYEKEILIAEGTTKDTDVGDVITVKYQINSGSVRNLHSAISDGSSPISFSKELTYSEGILKDGKTALTSLLSKDQPHTISFWAEDGNGGKSEVITRTFYVVPNRPPTLKVDPIAAKSKLINSDVINVNGSVEDLDNNDIVVTMQVNDQEPVEVYTGKSGAWAFNIALKDLRIGANTITIKATDTYDAFTSKVLTIRKTHDAVPINEAVGLYKINPPTESSQKILLWIERQLGDLAVTAEISMTNDGEPENFVTLPRTNTAPKEGLQEDEFAYQDAAQKTDIILKIIYNRTDSAAVATIKKISGVLS